MPVSNIHYFEGDIRSFYPEAFGYFYCKIKTPDYLDQPILQIYIQTNDGLRTVAGLGSYEDILFSQKPNKKNG